MKELATSFLTNKKVSAQWAWLPVVTGLIGAFCLQFSPAFKTINPGLRYFLLLPFLWADIALYALWGWHSGILRKPKFSPMLLEIAILAGLLEILGILISGRLWGFGYSPHTHQFPAILGHLFYAYSILIGTETARAYLLMRWEKGSAVPVFILIIVFFTILAIPPGILRQLDLNTSTFDLIWKTLVPGLAHSLLLTYLVWIGGPWTAITYSLFAITYQWLSPILPNLNSPAGTFVNTLLPIGILLSVNLAIGRDEEKGNSSADSPNKWFLVALFGAALLWLNAGLFGVRTFLISGVSMEPALKAGDIVLVKEYEPKEIQIGDVILYESATKLIMHRVIAISRSGNKLEYITKGDANYTPDPPVAGQNINGKAVFVIRKIGWLSLKLKRMIAWLI